MMHRSIAPALATLVAGVVLAGCVTSSHDGGGSAGAEPQAAAAPLGVFALLPNAPPAFVGLDGTAELTDGPEGGSDMSITLSGLKPNVRYLSHVHVGACDQPDPGGPHFKFDPNGRDAPPNEIHLRFGSNATGSATASAHSKRVLPDGAAGSIVVHQDTPASPTGASADKPKAAAGHEHHAGRSGVGTAGAAGGHTHATKIACAALRATDAARPATAPLADPSTEGAPLAIRVNADEPVGGVQKLEVRKDQRVRFTVTSDQPEEVHVHGYDVTKHVGPATPARFDFPAAIEGIFEVELEGVAAQILSLTVNPK